MLRHTNHMMIRAGARKPVENKVGKAPSCIEALAYTGVFFGSFLGFKRGLDVVERKVEPASASTQRLFQYNHEIARAVLMTVMYTATGAAAGAIMFTTWPITLPMLVAMGNLNGNTHENSSSLASKIRPF